VDEASVLSTVNQSILRHWRTLRQRSGDSIADAPPVERLPCGGGRGSAGEIPYSAAPGGRTRRDPRRHDDRIASTQPSAVAFIMDHA
jgi:hypothetical protein